MAYLPAAWDTTILSLQHLLRRNWRYGYGGSRCAVCKGQIPLNKAWSFTFKIAIDTRLDKPLRFPSFLRLDPIGGG